MSTLKYKIIEGKLLQGHSEEIKPQNLWFKIK